jgi:predicted short-subunit dehydrogenase-like oxidoreductase (DUF2520 family)
MEIGMAARGLEDLAASDAILVSVPDAAVPEVAARLAEGPLPLAGKIILHTSRIHDSSRFAPARRRGAAIASLQPMYTFERPIASLAGVYFAVEGDPTATAMARRMIQSWNGEFQLVSRKQKVRLGVAASISSDCFAGILDMAVQQMMLAGFLRKRAVDALAKVIEATLSDYKRSKRYSRAGPLLQGQAQTVRSYIEALCGEDPARADSYRRAALQTLEVMKRHDPRFGFLEQTIHPDSRPLVAAAGSRR